MRKIVTDPAGRKPLLSEGKMSGGGELAFERWREENGEAIEAHNRFIEKFGIWNEKFRSW